VAIGHDPFLVVLSVLIAVQASYVSLSLSGNVETSFGLQRRLLLGGAALSLAIGIWGMHFVGMLAAQLPIAVDYIVLPTLVSLFICVLVVGFAIFTASAQQRTVRSLAIAAFAMGRWYCVDALCGHARNSRERAYEPCSQFCCGKCRCSNRRLRACDLAGIRYDSASTASDLRHCPWVGHLGNALYGHGGLVIVSQYGGVGTVASVDRDLDGIACDCRCCRGVRRVRSVHADLGTRRRPQPGSQPRLGEGYWSAESSGVGAGLAPNSCVNYRDQIRQLSGNSSTCCRSRTWQEDQPSG
jgi:hypothetical protein